MSKVPCSVGRSSSQYAYPSCTDSDERPSDFDAIWSAAMGDAHEPYTAADMDQSLPMLGRRRVCARIYFRAAR